MNCPKTQELLRPFLEGTLQGEVLRQIREHIASCPECRSGFCPQDLVEILPALDTSIEPSEDFKSRFYAELEARRGKESQARDQGLRFSRIPQWSWRYAAAGILLMMGASVLYYRQYSYRPPDTAAVNALRHQINTI